MARQLRRWCPFQRAFRRPKLVTPGLTQASKNRLEIQFGVLLDDGGVIQATI